MRKKAMAGAMDFTGSGSGRSNRSIGFMVAACLLGLACVAMAVHLAHTMLGFASPAHDFLIQEWVYNFVTTTAAVLVLGRAVARPKDRLAWALIGTGLLFWAASDNYWTLWLGELAEPPFPSAADAGYLGGYLFLLGGVIALVRGRIQQISAIGWVDVAIGGLCVAAIGTAILLSFVLQNTTGTTMEIGVAIAYPILDLITLAVAAAALALTGWNPGRSLTLVIAGVILAGIADAVYTHQSLAGTYDTAAWNNSLWPLGILVTAFAALAPDTSKRTPATQGDGWREFASPSIFALAVFAFLLLTQHTDSLATLVLSTLTMAAIVTRIVLTFTENRRLVQRLQRDALTRLGNRSKLMIDLRRTLATEEPHVLSILDLDGFKAYNDAFGHPAGDAVLTRLGTKLLQAVEGRGFAYRLGGDEFAILVRGDRVSADDVIGAASEALAEEGEGFKIHSSIGSAELPREAAVPANALQLADQRMYAQKDSRRPTPGSEVEAVLLRILHQRTPELGAHGTSVSRLVDAVARRLEMSESERAALVRAAELHDVGKMAIPDALLQKPGPLNDEDWEFMRQHTILGERILSEAASLAPLGRVIRSSHERWDGAGYPDGLEGEEIPFAARIIFVCDAYDAMTSDRPYRESLSPGEALAEIRRSAGTQFDPDIVPVFAEALAETLSEHPTGLRVAGAGNSVLHA